MSATNHRAAYLALLRTAIWAGTLLQCALQICPTLSTDLRREAASRLLQDGMPLQHVSVFLGHTTVAQTATYLSVTESQLTASLAARRPNTTSAATDICELSKRRRLARNVAPGLGTRDVRTPQSSALTMLRYLPYKPGYTPMILLLVLFTTRMTSHESANPSTPSQLNRKIPSTPLMHTAPDEAVVEFAETAREAVRQLRIGSLAHNSDVNPTRVFAGAQNSGDPAALPCRVSQDPRL